MILGGLCVLCGSRKRRDQALGLGALDKDCAWVDGLVIGSGSLIPPPDAYGEALDCDLKFTSSGTEISDTWHADSSPVVQYYLNGDSAKSYAIGANEETCLQTIVESDSAETVKFYWVN